MKFGTDQLSVAVVRGQLARKPGMGVIIYHWHSGGGGKPLEGKILIMGHQCLDDWMRVGTNRTLSSLETIDCAHYPTWRCHYCGGNVGCHMQSSYLNRV